MRIIKIGLIFIVSILIPTALLAYFGLGAVRSEKLIIERNMNDRYKTMADIVATEIKRKTERIPSSLKGNKEIVEPTLLKEASIFKEEVVIFNAEGKPLDAGVTREIKDAVLRRPLMGFPYTIAVYERYPIPVLEKIENRKNSLSLYVSLIGFSAIFILGGSFFTLWMLSREWRLAELKSEFVADFSHELRRPLTSIRMFSEMLKDGRVPDEEKKDRYYGIITSESERLTYLANNILDFSRMERGRKIYDFKDGDIAGVIRETVDRFKAYLVEKTRPVMLNIGRDIPDIKMDARSISEALLNILVNATKYSPADKEITVNLTKSGKDVVIEVIDRGIGIPQKEKNRIFNKFYRTSQKEVTQTEGTGLGLTLVKYIIQAHRGRVKAESELGKGSKFSLILPGLDSKRGKRDIKV